MADPAHKKPAGTLNEELQALRPIAQVRTFRTGEIVFSTGDPGDGYYVVQTGCVHISAVVGVNESRLLAIIGPGDFFGEMAVLDDAPRSATARAEADTTALFLGRDTLLHLIEKRPHLALNLIREFSQRMRSLNQKYFEEILQAERFSVIGRFASTIVHDFKKPLSIIGLASELAYGADSSPTLRKKSRGHIAGQVARMSNMLNELIEFTRPSGWRPAFTAVNFSSYVQHLVEELQPQITEHQITLQTGNAPPEVEILVAPQRLSRLFYNLVNNAVDAMGEQGGKITLHFSLAGRELRVDVEDTGPGIPPEIAAQLFQPFVTHGKPHGTGLGLSICKRIAEDHGGRIWARQEPGRGAMFSFTLPLPPPAAPPAAVQAEQPAKPAAAKSNGTRPARRVAKKKRSAPAPARR